MSTEVAQDEASPQPRSTAARVRRHVPNLLVFSVVAAVGLAVRLWQLVGRQPLGWGDSDDYRITSRAALFSLDLWAGERPLAVPLLLKLVARDDVVFLYVQATVAALCWAALAVSVATVSRYRFGIGRGAFEAESVSMPTGWRRWVGVAVVTGFSVTYQVTMWEPSILSESLAISFLALVLAAGLQLVRGVTWWRVAALLVALTLWLITRDTHGVVVLALALGLAGWVILRPHGQSELPLMCLAGAAFFLALLANAAAAHGQRHAFPMRNVYAVRVLPYPDRVEWFADHGMPQAELFVDPDVPGARAPVAAEPGHPLVTWVGEEDPVISEWSAWFEREGRATFMRWVLTHPSYLLTEPWREPERSFNNAEGDRSFYAPGQTRQVPWVSGILVPAQPFALLVGLAASAWVIRHGRWREPLFLVGAAAVLLAAPHALVSWHSDGMEAVRHLTIPMIQFHLGVVLLVLAAIAGVSDHVSTEAGSRGLSSLWCN